MLTLVFGAGASYDSDPARPAANQLTTETDEYRPPLATALFSPRSKPAREAASAFPRAAPLLMRLREAVARGEDVEQVLEELQAEGARYSATASQSLALRAYLAQLMDQVPSRWSEQCQGLTNYVLALDEAARWNEAAHGSREPVAAISFNYDTLLEDAVTRVYGSPISDLDDYVASPSIHVYKPHGSVSWRQEATWHPGSIFMGIGALHRAIDVAADLQWRDDYRMMEPETWQPLNNAELALLPALTIPVQDKAAFSIPDAHLESLKQDLGRTTMLVTIGWRAREQHFLRLLQDHLPSVPIPVVVVAERRDSAMETLDNLWPTGRFHRYSISAAGFSAFAESSSTAFHRQEDEVACLRDVLTGGGDALVDGAPGSGLPEQGATRIGTATAYSDF